MSTPNLPDGTIRSGLPFDFCLSDYALPVPVISQASSLVSAPRNVFNAYPSNAQSRGNNILQKPTVSNSTSNFSLVTTNNITQSNTNSFANYPAFNSIFQTLLRGTNSSQVTVSPSNVSGYINTITGPTGNLFTGFRPTQLPYQSNMRITTPGIVSSGSTHGTVNSVALKSTNYNTRNNMNSTPTCTTVVTTTCSSLTTTSRTPVASVDSLFISSNLVPVPNSINGMQKLGPMAFLRWAEVCTRLFKKERISVWPRCKVDTDALHEMNWIIAPPGLLGIYSESPFLRPVVLLRRVQFTASGNINPNIPDTDNMVRSLREMADAKVTKYPGFAPHFPPSAASVGFTTDYMTYVFNLELERQVVKLLRSKTGGHSDWRVVLRLGWATTDFYVPNNALTNVASHRALVLESLPRCLSVRVSGRPVPLPDPIFHGGQAQRLGKRLRLSIDITDKILMKYSSAVRNKIVDIELTWLHAPLEDQSVELLNLVADGLVSPLLCHLIGMPLVQVTLDRAYTVADLRNTFNLDNVEAHKQFLSGPFLDPVEFPSLIMNPDGSGPLKDHGVFGAYDNCLPPAFSLPAENTKHELKSRLQKTSNDNDDLSIEDVDVQLADYIPICLLCPLTRTRIDVPVRSFNCSHLQCFDLHSYLTINMRRPRWSCPICGISAPFRDLRVDELFMSILKNPRSSDAEFVQLDANGDWRLNNPNDIRSTGVGGVGGSGGPLITESNQQTTTNEQNIVSNSNCAAAEGNTSNPLKKIEISDDLTTKENHDQLTEQSTPVTTINTTTATTTVGTTDTLVKRPEQEANNTNTIATVNHCDSSHQSEPEVIILSDDDDDDVGDDKGKESNNDSANRAACTNQTHKDNMNSVFPCLKEKASTNIISTHALPFEIDLTNDDSDSSSYCESTNRGVLEPFFTTNDPSNISTNDIIQQSDISSDFIRTRDEIRFGNKGPLIVISPLPPISIANALSGSMKETTDLNSNIDQFTTTTTINNELTIDPKQILRLDSSSSNWPTEQLVQNALRTSNINNNSNTINNMNLYNTDGSKSAFYQRLLEATAHRVNQTMLKKNSHCSLRDNERLLYDDKKTISPAFGSTGGSGASKRKGNSTRLLNNNNVESRPKTSRKVLTSDSEEELADKACSIIPSSSTTTSGRNAHMIKQQQVAALARLIQERSSRVVKSMPDTSNEQNQNGIENLPSTSSTSRRVMSKRKVVRTQSKRKKKRPTRKRPLRRRPSNISDDDDDSDSSSQSLYTSEMSCVSISEPSTDSSFVNSSQYSDDEDEEESVESFSSDDRWSPSQVGSSSKKQQTKRKPPKLRR
ncbi:unnamed protein product [Schistosoma turkestanicum]|nr:unnamed protein product [Schistosoma turkestanicum]